jgi:hypothetical protein
MISGEFSLNKMSERSLVFGFILSSLNTNSCFNERHQIMILVGEPKFVIIIMGNIIMGK